MPQAAMKQQANPKPSKMKPNLRKDRWNNIEIQSAAIEKGSGLEDVEAKRKLVAYVLNELLDQLNIETGFYKK